MLKHQKGASMNSMKEQKFFDQNLLISSLVYIFFLKLFDFLIYFCLKQKREKKKTHAFHFIEKGSIIKKAETLRKRITIINKDTSNPTESQKKSVKSLISS